MLPIPAGVCVGGEHDGVVVLPVLGQHFAVDVLRHFLLEGEVEPRLVKEDAAHQPDEGRKTHEKRKSVEAHSPIGARGDEHEHACRDAYPTRVRDAAYAGTGRDEEFLLDRLYAYGFEFVRHMIGEFALIVRARQTGTYLVRRRLDDAERFVGVLFQFFSHISSLFPRGAVLFLI